MDDVLPQSISKKFLISTRNHHFLILYPIFCLATMVSMNMETLVSGIKLSSVVPAKVTGNNKAHELSNMDLAMKLHYIKGVYFFKSEAVQGASIDDLKQPMFHWLEINYIASGRIRKSEKGKPFIKCNDAGVRIVEAYCEKTIDEWLAMDDRSLDNYCLAYNQVLGPDLGFSPLVFVQFTWFNCGGLSVGLSWAHVLGDAFSAATFINMWGQIMAGHVPQKSLHVPSLGKSESPTSVIPGKLFSMKRVDPVGDHWLTANNCKMVTYHFHVTAKQLDHFVSNVYDPNQASNMSHFDVLSAIIWKSLSKIREDSGPRNVTICTNGHRARGNEIPTNCMVLKNVEPDFSVAKGDISELAMLIGEKRVDEINIIEETLMGDNEKSDFLVYGANLTFVNLEEANIYGLELKGKKPVFVNYTFNGVGDEGVVLVLPGPKEEGGIGRRVTMVLPENQLAQLMNELKKDWGLV